MSDHDTVPPEIEDEIRARLQAFTRQVAQRADTEAALRRMPRRSRPPTIRLIAIAACLLAVVGLAVAIKADRQSVDTTDPSDLPTKTTLARGVVGFVERLHGNCCVPTGGGFDGPPGGGLAGQSLDITAEEEDGAVTGEARFTLHVTTRVESDAFEMVVELECADTDTDDVVLGGKVTTSSDDGLPAVGELMAVIIREGEPDSATVWWDAGVSSCSDLLESVPEPHPDDAFIDVVEGDDIETGG